MPNNCLNRFFITGEQSSLQKFWDGLKKFDGHDESENGEIYIFKSYIPMPVELRNTSQFKDTPNWHDWVMANWGSKWGDYETEINFSPTMISGHFFSAWGPCEEGFVNLSRMFPDLNFSFLYEEPGMCLSGERVFKNGIMLDVIKK